MKRAHIALALIAAATMAHGANWKYACPTNVNSWATPMLFGKMESTGILTDARGGVFVGSRMDVPTEKKECVWTKSYAEHSVKAWINDRIAGLACAPFAMPATYPDYELSLLDTGMLCGGDSFIINGRTVQRVFSLSLTNRFCNAAPNTGAAQEVAYGAGDTANLQTIGYDPSRPTLNFTFSTAAECATQGRKCNLPWLRDRWLALADALDTFDGKWLKTGPLWLMNGSMTTTTRAFSSTRKVPSVSYTWSAVSAGSHCDVSYSQAQNVVRDDTNTEQTFPTYPGNAQIYLSASAIKYTFGYTDEWKDDEQKFSKITTKHYNSSTLNVMSQDGSTKFGDFVVSDVGAGTITDAKAVVFVTATRGVIGGQRTDREFAIPLDISYTGGGVFTTSATVNNILQAAITKSEWHPTQIMAEAQSLVEYPNDPTIQEVNGGHWNLGGTVEKYASAGVFYQFVLGSAHIFIKITVDY